MSIFECQPRNKPAKDIGVCVCVLLRCVFLLGASWRLIPGFEQKVAVCDIEFESTRAFRCLHGCCQMFTRHKCGKQKAAELWQCQLSEMLLGVYMALLYQRQLHLVLGGPFQPPRNPISALKFNWGDIIALLPQPLATQLNVYSPGNKHSNSKITGTCQVFQDFPSTSSIRHIHGHDWHKDAQGRPDVSPAIPAAAPTDLWPLWTLRCLLNQSS